jgi:hypothetical protein
MSTQQKYRKYDHVRVAADLGPYMSHFQSGCEAIVIASYKDQFGGTPSDRHQYTIHIKGSGEVSWYNEAQLELIGHNPQLLKQWEDEAAKEIAIKSDLDWIFANGPDVVIRSHGSTIATLGRDLGITDLWGSRGEGVTYFANCRAVLILAAPFLKAKDKAGWLKRAAEIKAQTSSVSLTSV